MFENTYSREARGPQHHDPHMPTRACYTAGDLGKCVTTPALWLSCISPYPIPKCGHWPHSSAAAGWSVTWGWKRSVCERREVMSPNQWRVVLDAETPPARGDWLAAVQANGLKTSRAGRVS